MGDLIVLICQVVSLDQVFKGLCYFMGGSPSQYVATLTCLVICKVATLTCKVISEDLVEAPCGKSPPCQVCHRHCSSEHIITLVTHVISPDPIIRESCDFNGRSLLR